MPSATIYGTAGTGRKTANGTASNDDAPMAGHNAVKDILDFEAWWAYDLSSIPSTATVTSASSVIPEQNALHDQPTTWRYYDTNGDTGSPVGTLYAGGWSTSVTVDGSRVKAHLGGALWVKLTNDLVRSGSTGSDYMQLVAVTSCYVSFSYTTNVAPTATVTSPAPEGVTLRSYGPGRGSLSSDNTLQATFTDPDSGQTLQTYYEVQTQAGAAVTSGNGSNIATPAASVGQTFPLWDSLVKGTAYRWRPAVNDGLGWVYAAWRNFQTAQQPLAPGWSNAAPTGGVKVRSLRPPLVMRSTIPTEAGVSGTLRFRIYSAANVLVADSRFNEAASTMTVSVVGVSSTTADFTAVIDSDLAPGVYTWKATLEYTGYGPQYDVDSPTQTFEVYPRKPNLVKIGGAFVEKPMKVKVGGVFVDASDPV